MSDASGRLEGLGAGSGKSRAADAVTPGRLGGVAWTAGKGKFLPTKTFQRQHYQPPLRREGGRAPPGHKEKVEVGFCPRDAPQPHNMQSSEGGL